MLSLPTLPRQAKQTEVPVTHRSYLRIAPQHRNPQYSLEREALEAMQQKRYLYIDFQSNSTSTPNQAASSSLRNRTVASMSHKMRLNRSARARSEG